MGKKRCSDCRYFQVKRVVSKTPIDIQAVYGMCHRFPPKTPEMFTEVEAIDWCGEFSEIATPDFIINVGDVVEVKCRTIYGKATLEFAVVTGLISSTNEQDCMIGLRLRDGSTVVEKRNLCKLIARGIK